MQLVQVTVDTNLVESASRISTHTHRLICWLLLLTVCDWWVVSLRPAAAVSWHGGCARLTHFIVFWKIASVGRRCHRRRPPSGAGMITYTPPPYLSLHRSHLHFLLFASIFVLHQDTVTLTPSLLENSSTARLTLGNAWRLYTCTGFRELLLRPRCRESLFFLVDRPLT